jgi:hypothetical protein
MLISGGRSSLTASVGVGKEGPSRDPAMDLPSGPRLSASPASKRASPLDDCLAEQIDRRLHLRGTRSNHVAKLAAVIGVVLRNEAPAVLTALKRGHRQLKGSHADIQILSVADCAPLQSKLRHPPRKFWIHATDFMLVGTSAAARMSAVTLVNDCYGAWRVSQKGRLRPVRVRSTRMGTVGQLRPLEQNCQFST